MESKTANVEMRKSLRNEVSRFYRRDKRIWKQPIVDMLRTLQEANTEAVFFGGTLRSLLISRLLGNKQGRPRDIDIVVSGNSVDEIKEIVKDKIERETRFGGLKVQEANWEFDLWPLEKTWAFVKDDEAHREFSELPKTTFFNMEAIAVEVWPKPGKARKVFAGNNQFFNGIRERVLEINREENPYPSLCVVRGLIMASGLGFDLGPKLTKYIASHGDGLTLSEIEEVQRAHYGSQRRMSTELKSWISHVAEAHVKRPSSNSSLPVKRQKELWPGKPLGSKVCIHAIKSEN
ncbi:MAG: hypothetical protein AAFN77_18290 [Planctomycetota bacterium]